jgi:hypothetical protein
MSENNEVEIKDAGPNGRVIPSHSTSVDRTSAWDRTVQFRKMRSPATPSYYDDIFAFQLPNTKGTRKTHYSFVHHFVGEGGRAGAASGRALSNSVAVLNGGRQGTVLRGAARQGVYRHIAAHYADADMQAPELKSDEDVDAIMMFKGLIDAPLAESLDLTVKGLQDLDNIIDVESDVAWIEGKTEMKGIVVEADDDSALVEQVDEKGERTGEFFELDYAEMKLRTFVVMEKVDGMAEAGAIVSWETTQGTFYGDVVSVETDGKVRGEPQGLELEGTEENPAYLIRVWMQEAAEEEDEAEDDEDMPEEEASLKSAGEWHPTNVTVVARGDALKVEEALPTGDPEEGYSEGEDEEESAMKKMDTEFMALVERAMKQNAEILERLAQYDSGDVTEEVAPVAEEAKSDEVATEVAAETAEIVEEKAAEEIPAVETTETVEEVKSEEAAAEQTETTEATTEVVEEKAADDQKQTAAISFDDLKEFHLLLKEMSK